MEQCNTVVEAVTSVVEETAFETQCAMVSDRECKTEIQTSYATQLETQCSPGYGTKCKPQQKTAYRKFCTTVQDTECRVTVQSSSQTTYEQKCSTSYEKVCSGHGYHQKCENVPKQNCQQVPKQVAVSNPVRQCSQVPKERCHQVSVIKRVEIGHLTSEHVLRFPSKCQFRNASMSLSRTAPMFLFKAQWLSLLRTVIR